MPAETNKQWVIRSFSNSFDCLEENEATIPSVGEYDVLVKIEAVSLNYRDASIPMVGPINHFALFNLLVASQVLVRQETLTKTTPEHVPL